MATVLQRWFRRSAAPDEKESALIVETPALSRAEWLEADGLGGFASGTVCTIRTRRYHALLLVATAPPAGRMVLVNGLDAWAETEAGSFALGSHQYAPEVIHPDGAQRIESFTIDPWPRWIFAVPGGVRIEHGVIVVPGRASTALYWRLLAGGGATLNVRPLMSGRDYHALHHENPAFNFTAEVRGDRTMLRPYQGVPAVVAHVNGAYSPAPVWYRNFVYAEERSRGLDCIEDLAAPGVFRFELARGEATLVLSAEGHEPAEPLAAVRAAEERRRAAFPSRLHRAADAYVVRRGTGKTIVAGYPWFTDWGRDTFISLRGLCLAGDRSDDARAILVEWAGTVSEGMLPNRFPDRGDTPEYNAVDASLWYVVAAHELMVADRRLPPRDRELIEDAIEAILAGYAGGTRFGIRLDSDGLLAAGQPGVQLTWMDAKVGDWVVTPRIGKPVEVQALWLNALRIAGARNSRWNAIYARGKAAFEARFWDDERGFLADVADPDYRTGDHDSTLRPNQIFAVGGLPFAVLSGDRARRVVDVVEQRLLTPIGLRSLAPGEPSYAPRYEGGVHERDGAYHQGTVWPWLMGPFVDAWVRVRGSTAAARREARAKFLDPLLMHMHEGGLGHLPEIADGDPPHTPRGCPFQAWSVGEALRIARLLG
jgi:predicted glycogen debranching enzyme